MWRKSLAVSLLAFCALAISCKTRKSFDSPASVPPAMAGATGEKDSLPGSSEDCQATLNLLPSPEPADPASLRLAEARADSYRIRPGYRVTRLQGSLPARGPHPDLCLFQICTDKRSGPECHYRTSAICSRYVRDLPEGVVNVTSRACIRPERVPGYPNLTAYSEHKVLLAKELLYCGPAQKHYGHISKNTDRKLAGIQALIEVLEERRKKFGRDIIRVVRRHLKEDDLSGSSAAELKSWQNLVVSEDLSAEAIAFLYEDAKSETDLIAKNPQRIAEAASQHHRLQLAHSDSCVRLPDRPLPDQPLPELPEQPKKAPAQMPEPDPAVPPPELQPVVRAQPDTDQGQTDTDQGQTDTDQGQNSSTTPPDNQEPDEGGSREGSKYAKVCQQRGAWLQEQGLGTTRFERGRCFHFGNQGEPVEIEASVAPEALSAKPDPIDNLLRDRAWIDEQTEPTLIERAGSPLMALGLFMGLGGGTAYYTFNNKIKMIGDQEARNAGIRQEPGLDPRPDRAGARGPQAVKGPGKPVLSGASAPGSLKSRRAWAKRVGLAGAAVFVLGGLSKVAFGLSRGGSDSLSRKIITDPLFLRSLRDLETANELIKGLNKISRDPGPSIP